MIRFRHQPGCGPNLALAALLLAAQFGAAWHVLDHDVGTPQNNVCASCVAAEQLSSACVDTPSPARIAPAQDAYEPVACSSYIATHRLASRQRGPPEIN